MHFTAVAAELRLLTCRKFIHLCRHRVINSNSKAETTQERIDGDKMHNHSNPKLILFI